MTQIQRVDRHAQRLQYRAFSVTEPIGQPVQPGRRPGHKLAHQTVLSAVPGKHDRGAQVAVAVQAAAASPTRDRRVDRDPLAPPGPVLDDPGALMPQHKRMLQHCIPDCCLTPPVQV